MKNLFKNLMLVAVAAMAFTACQKDNGELDAPKRIVNFTANIGGDDTRSGFTPKEDNVNVYKSAWDGGETLFVKAENTEKWPTIDAEGKFSVEFSADDQFATFYSPVASWEYNTSYGIYMPVVPAIQTPRAKSVDPAAHILQAQSVYISGSENIKVTFEHAVAYGKMTVNTPAEFVISKVEINLVGAYYGVEKDLTYTINADNVENNVFWFATEPLNVSEMTVTAYGKEGETDKIYSKTVTVNEGKLEFYYGHVGSFSVSNLTEEVANVFEPTYLWDQDFAWASDCFKLTDNDYPSAYWRIYLNEADRPGNNSIKEGKYTCAVNKTNPGQGQFCVKIYGGGANMDSIYPSYTSAEDTLEVKIVDGQYQILYTHGTISHGYKGLTDGIVLPSEGGDSGDDNTGDSGEEDGFIQMTKLYYDSSAQNIHNFIMSDADGSNKITISFNKYDVTQTWIPVYEYTSKSLSAVNSYSGYCSLQYDTAKINGTSYQLNADGHTLKVLSSSNGGNHEIELYVVTSGGDEYKFKFSGNLGL